MIGFTRSVKARKILNFLCTIKCHSHFRDLVGEFRQKCYILTYLHHCFNFDKYKFFHSAYCIISSHSERDASAMIFPRSMVLPMSLKFGKLHSRLLTNPYLPIWGLLGYSNPALKKLCALANHEKYPQIFIVSHCVSELFVMLEK